MHKGLVSLRGKNIEREANTPYEIFSGGAQCYILKLQGGFSPTGPPGYGPANHGHHTQVYIKAAFPYRCFLLVLCGLHLKGKHRDGC